MDYKANRPPYPLKGKTSIELVGKSGKRRLFFLVKKIPIKFLHLRGNGAKYIFYEFTTFNTLVCDRIYCREWIETFSNTAESAKITVKT